MVLRSLRLIVLVFCSQFPSSVMKITAVFSTLVMAIAADAARLESRQSSTCYAANRNLAAYERRFVYPLVTQCRNELGDSVASKENPWVSKNCVAAAIAASVCDFIPATARSLR